MSYTAHLDTFARDRLPPPQQWPEFRFDLPELRYPEVLNCAAVLIDDAVAEGHGTRIALIGADERLNYAALTERANRIAGVLTNQLGLVPGNRVLLRGANTPTLAAAWLGTIKAGGIVVTTMPMLRARELGVIAAKAQVQFTLCEDALAGELRTAAAPGGTIREFVTFGAGDLESRMARESGAFEAVPTARDDVCLLAFTSGTTGSPKATMHFHRDVLAMADVFARHVLETSPGDVHLGSPPLGFTFGLGALLVFPLRFRAASVLPGTMTPAQLLETTQATRATCLFTAPTMYRTLASLAGGYDLSSLRHCVSAGAPLPRATFDLWHQTTGMKIIDGIGTTEMIHIFISAKGDDIRPGATGKPLPGYSACVLDAEGRPLPLGSTGRLAVKGPTGCRYLADERQASYVVNGWNVTGDQYRVDAEGYFWFVARGDDMIISAGYNIAGPEVEAALLEHPAVAECAVVGSPDAERGQRVKAFVVLNAGPAAGPALAAELQDFVKATIAPYKYPRAVEFVSELPKTQTGKVQHYLLRQLEELRSLPAGSR